MTFLVSTSQPTNAALGDEWFNPTTNQLYKLIPINGTTLNWIPYGAQANLVYVGGGGGGGTTTVTSNVLTYALVPSPGPYTLGYLLVAGGGAGATVLGGPNFSGGGGGAGGLIQGNSTVSPGQTITVSMGAGGAATNTPSIPTFGTTASNTTLSGGLSIIAYGGGMGMQNIGPPYAGGPTGTYFMMGGSGGGSFWDSAFPALTGLAFGSPAFGVAGPQGYPGGPHVPSNETGATGGGGAGGAGVAIDPANGSVGTAGGPGISSFLTPPTSIYAGGGNGGGGGGGVPVARAPGGGGFGGYGNVAPGNQAGGSGDAYTGGGGGGAAGYNNAPPTTLNIGGNGGSGVAKFAMPTPAYNAGVGYSGSNVAVSTPAQVPGMTVITFNSSGSLTT